MGAAVRQLTDVSQASLKPGIFVMSKAKRPGSKSRSGEKSRSKRGRQTPNRSDDRKIAQAKPGPDDLLNERDNSAAAARKSKLSSHSPTSSEDHGPVMSDTPDTELLKPIKAARFINMSESFLAKARMKGDGPTYLKLGRAVRYRKSDLVAWLKRRGKTSTAE